MERPMQLKNILADGKKTILLKQKLNSVTEKGFSMRFRLFLLLIVTVVTIMLGVVAILLVTGYFTAGIAESKRLVENELSSASEEISKRYGVLSLHAIEFSKALSRSIEKKAARMGTAVSDLQGRPELLEEIIAGEFDRTLFSLQLSKSSGAFFILNATVNPALHNAKNSRAGLYLKNMEPNIVNSLSPTIIIFRGFPSIGRNNSLPLHAQWKMEFDISDAPYYHRPVDAAKQNNHLPLSQLYYWSHALTIPETSEEVMLCSVPLIDSKGNVFGVCGLEISAMLFKLSHAPKNNIYNRMFCLLSPINGEAIYIDKGMFAGGYSAKYLSEYCDTLQIAEGKRSFYSYRQDGNSLFLGLHKPVSLYPDESLFAQEKWAAAIMIPEEDVVDSVTKLNVLILSLLTLLVLIGVIVSFFLSRRFIKPILESFDVIKTSNFNETQKTKIPEIDDLIEFLSSSKQEHNEKEREKSISLSILDEFVENTKTLSSAERAVFNLYVKGYKAKEIADILCLSINTVKTHNKRIYMKLNIASREELLLYVTMLKELGKEI